MAGLNFGERDPVAPAVAASGSPVAGKRWVITGTLSQTREEVTETILELRRKVSGSLSNKTDYLLAGADGGSKLEKARTLGVKIVDEAGFRRMLGGDTTESQPIDAEEKQGAQETLILE